MGLAATSNEGLVSVDNTGSVRLWETGVANLQGGDSIMGSSHSHAVSVVVNLAMPPDGELKL